MANWSNATITNKGYALQAKLLTTDRLVITRVVSGSGRVAAGQLVNQTEVSDIQQDLKVESLGYDANGNAILEVSLNNESLSASYVCNQIGVYAFDEGKEILYMIAQEATTGESIPSIAEQPNGYYCGWKFTLTYSNNSNISVTIDPANALTVAAADARYLKESDADNKYITAEKANETFVSEADLVGRKTDTTEIYRLPNGEEAAPGEGGEIFNDYNCHEDNMYGYDDNGCLQFGNIACGQFSSSSGTCNVASGKQANNTGGTKNWAGGHNSGNYVGYNNKIQPEASYAANIGGRNNVVKNSYGINIGGLNNSVEENGGVNLGGAGLIAYRIQTVAGRYNDVSTTAKKGPANESSTSGSLFMVGIGTSDSARSNAFRVSADGRCYGLNSFGGSGADIAEYYEWLDGNPDNEDRRGLFVTLDGKKIKLANADDDYILGVISAMPMIVGGIQSENWHDMYLKDVFGQRITETVEVEETTDEEGNVIPAHTETRWVLNPEYDPSREYVSREFRKEWGAVGIIGQLVIVDDGTCEVNGYAKPSNNGTGTAAEGKTPYRVMERIDESHVLINIK